MDEEDVLGGDRGGGAQRQRRRRHQGEARPVNGVGVCCGRGVAPSYMTAWRERGASRRPRPAVRPRFARPVDASASIAREDEVFHQKTRRFIYVLWSRNSYEYSGGLKKK